MSFGDFLLYGANGYVGRAAAELAVAQGLRPLVAGRNEAAVRTLADRLDLEARVFDLDDSRALTDALAEVPVVLSCPGRISTPTSHWSTLASRPVPTTWTSPVSLPSTRPSRPETTRPLRAA